MISQDITAAFCWGIITAPYLDANKFSTCVSVAHTYTVKSNVNVSPS